MDMVNRPQGAALAREALHRAEAVPSLAELGRGLGYGEAELVRALAAWAGGGPAAAAPWARLLSPEVGQWLLAERRAGFPPVAATPQPLADSGLAHSGGLRLPWTGCSPQEAAGLSILWGWFDGPFGLMAVAGVAKDGETGRHGLCGLAFAGEGGAQEKAAALADLRDRWPRSGFVERPEALAPWVAAMVRGAGEVPLLLIGTPFERAVWQALLEIPSGRVASYTQVAQRAGKPRAVRAVASAIGRNPLSWLVPCHRALRQSGALGGYYWGLPVKRALLAREAARDRGAQPPA